MTKSNGYSEFMRSSQSAPVPNGDQNPADGTYRVWACDNQVYGPVSWDILVEWAVDGRVTPDTWVYLDTTQEWRQARGIAALQESFPAGENTTFFRRQAEETGGIQPEELRQFAVLASFSIHDLALLIRLGQLVPVEKDDTVIRRGEPGDALFFVLAGSVRARIFVGGDEKTLANISAGEFFGDMAMFTQSPRSADVVANGYTRLLRFGAEAFRLLILHNPSVAAPLLFGIAGTMAHRILDDNQRFQREVASGFVWR